MATQERERIVRFRDPEQWLAWTRSHGTRMLWELVPPERHGELTRIATERLLAMRDAGGAIPLRVVLRIASARNP